jgi:protoporphyrinogen/coproporphyrinogen III oxidase
MTTVVEAPLTDDSTRVRRRAKLDATGTGSGYGPSGDGRSGAHVVVVGGGMAGLAAAHRLVRRDATVRVTVVESGDRLGGMIRTEHRDGCILEAGPDLFLGAKPGAWELAHALGIEDRLVGTREGLKGSYLLSRGRLRRMPEGLTGLIPTRMMPFVTTPLISIFGKLRVAMDIFIPPRRDDRDESVESFVVRRLGREMYEKIVEPLLSGIFAGDGHRLSLRAAFPQMRNAELEHGSMTRSMLAAKRRPAAGGPKPRGMMTFRGGMYELVAAVEDALLATERVRILTATSCTALQRGDPAYVAELSSGELLEADAVVAALPAHAAASLFSGIDEDCARLMEAVEYVATATVNVAYRREDVPHALDGSGWIAPRGERRPVMACTWTTSKFEGRAPAGVAVFRAFLGDARSNLAEACSDDDMVRNAREELAAVLGIRSEPLFIHVTRWEPGLPQPNLGHLESVAEIEQRLGQHPGLEIAGSSYHGIGIPDVVRSGERAADRVIAFMRGETAAATTG